MSYIDVSPDSDFSIKNLPYGVFSTHNNVSILLLYFVRNHDHDDDGITILLTYLILFGCI